MQKRLVCMALGLVMCLSLAGCAQLQNVAENLGSITQGGMSVISYGDEKEYNIGNGVVAPEGIKNIDVNWISGKVYIEASAEATEISISESADNDISEDYKLRYLAKDGTLWVQFSRPGNWDFNRFKKELKIVIPSSMELTAVTTDTVSAELQMDGITSESLKFNTVSGDVMLNGGSYSKVKGNGVSAEALFQTEIKDEIDVSTVSGDTTLFLKEGKGFSGKLQTVSGSFNSVFPYTGSAGDFTSGDGSLVIDADSVSGSFTILKA